MTHREPSVCLVYKCTDSIPELPTMQLITLVVHYRDTLILRLMKTL